ncbi:MAG: PEP/pyruvate-binding domain-containing protein [Acidimicrobiales bacterium]
MPLDCLEARDPSLTGAKAAALAVLLEAGHPVRGGFVITTAATAGLAGDAGWPSRLEQEIRGKWSQLSSGGSTPLVVRSSSTVEDGADASMAGLFTSVLDVRRWEDFVGAVAAVVASAHKVKSPPAEPLAVLVQPMVRASIGGVLFGADPVTGRTDRRIVAAVTGGPDRLVSGGVDGAHYVLTQRGRVLAAESPLPGLRAHHRRSLCRLATRLEHRFGRPQDVEWAIDVDDKLVVFQTRAITALHPPPARLRARGPVYGAGPVSETFPDALRPMEQELWLEPLRDGLREALLLSGARGRRSLRRSPGVVVVGGRVAVDLDLLGSSPLARSALAALDLRRPGRRLIAAWRVGRLKAAFPALAADVAADVDRRLVTVPAFEELGDEDLVVLLRRSVPVLRTVHAYEVLAGLLTRIGEAGANGAALALWALGQGRAAGLTDEDIVVESPSVLALSSPRIGPAPTLPASAPAFRPQEPDADAIATWREILRLRARWVQELTARAAWTLGLRLVERGGLAEPAAVASLSLDQVAGLARGEVLSAAGDAPEPGPPLPAAFRLGPAGEVVALDATDSHGGWGAGGGKGRGRVHNGEGPPPPGAVLVVRTLDPGLAPLLPGLGGLVAETGSVLSHLAILAREFGVPTAVAVPDAIRRFPPGSLISVDGESGDVVVVEPAPSGARP